MKRKLFRSIIEILFIIFLFYANLLMGEYTHSGRAIKKGIWWAAQDMITVNNFCIAFTLSVVGFIVFEFLRKKI